MKMPSYQPIDIKVDVNIMSLHPETVTGVLLAASALANVFCQKLISAGIGNRLRETLEEGTSEIEAFMLSSIMENWINPLYSVNLMKSIFSTPDYLSIWGEFMK
jgi:hypothetical protein